MSPNELAAAIAQALELLRPLRVALVVHPDSVSDENEARLRSIRGVDLEVLESELVEPGRVVVVNIDALEYPFDRSRP